MSNKPAVASEERDALAAPEGRKPLVTVKKVLVVDDDPVIGKSFDRVLAGKGFKVVRASSGEEALQKLNEQDFDAMFVDERMPGLKGTEVAERLKGKRFMPIVIITGYHSREMEDKARMAGVTRVVQKPLTPDMIEAEATMATADGAARGEAARAAGVTEKDLRPIELPKRSVLKDIGLFFASPFVGLLYILTLPFVGLGLAVWQGGVALKDREVSIRLNLSWKQTLIVLAAMAGIAIAYIALVAPWMFSWLLWFLGKKIGF